MLAAAGSAIGLGAIWKFPYVAGNAGGGAFFFVFLFFTLFVGLPILLAEFIIGRGSQKDAVSAYQYFVPHSSWHWIGRWGILASCILLSFYSVVGGWILIYLFRALTGGVSGLDGQYGQLFADLTANPIVSVGAQLVFLLLTVLVVARGVQRGIEKASKIMMPALFVFFLILIIRSLTLSGAGEGIAFFLNPDFASLDAKTILFALGQSFFALSIGISCMVTYSSYVPKAQSLPKSATTIVLMNILISLLAGLAIFPAVFSFGFEPKAGPGLLFVVLPAVFNQMPFGLVFFVVFLLLFLFATLTSAFSMLELVVAALTKGDFSKRKKSAWMMGTMIFIIGVPAALSFGILSDVKIFGQTIFDLFDFLVSNIMLPLGALAISIFVPAKISHKTLLEEISAGTRHGKRLFAVWLLLIRYVAPIAIIIAFLNVIGVFDWIGL